MKKNNRIGCRIKHTVGGETYHTYIPQPLPPDPHLDLANSHTLMEQALVAMGRLDGKSEKLPDPELFLYTYVRKEALLSSQIEGTQSSLSDLLLFENDFRNYEAADVGMDDVKEVFRYVAAMKYGLDRLKEFPLSLRLIREIHTILMEEAPGSSKQPGEFRTSQNWIGGKRPGNAVFVPPPPEKMKECLHDFELFLHDEKVKLPVLIKAALAHVQFETIHPFLDGNGRLGRLLIILILCNGGILKQPLLYLSWYFKVNRQAYYDHLQDVRETGNWEAWIHFFLTGVMETANQARETAEAITQLFDNDLNRIKESGKLTAGVRAVHEHLKRHTVSVTTAMCLETGLSLPTVIRSLAALESMGIVTEISGKKRNRIFVYQKYLELLHKDTEPLSS